MKRQKLKRKTKQKKNPYRQTIPQGFETDKWYVLELGYHEENELPPQDVLLQFLHYDEETPIFRENVEVLYPKNILSLDEILKKYKEYKEYEIYGPYETAELIYIFSKLSLKRELAILKKRERQLKKKWWIF